MRGYTAAHALGNGDHPPQGIYQNGKANIPVMKLSRRDPYRPRRHPLFFMGPLLIALLVLLLVVSWMKGGEKPVGEIEMPVPSEKLAG